MTEDEKDRLLRTSATVGKAVADAAQKINIELDQLIRDDFRVVLVVVRQNGEGTDLFLGTSGLGTEGVAAVLRLATHSAELLETPEEEPGDGVTILHPANTTTH